MEPHGQSPWYLHKIPSYAKASEGYPPSAKSAKAAILQLMNNSGTVYAFTHGKARGLLRRRIKAPEYPQMAGAHGAAILANESPLKI
jgi:hypothetical protein